MHPELEKLLDLQEKDDALATLDEALGQVREERDQLDTLIARARTTATAAEAALNEGRKRQEELEVKVESLRTIQERRRQRMEQVRTAKEAQALTLELDAARSIIVKEENDWVRVADQVRSLETALAEAQETLATLEQEQQEARAALQVREDELMGRRSGAQASREASAREVERPLLARYDRLRGARSSAVVVAMHGAACGACYTTIPMNRRSQIRAGLLVEGCEACGVILYVSDHEA